MNAHTPGPWKVVNRGAVLSPEGRVAQACSQSVAKSEADAQLIATAPDLLIFAKEIAMGCYTENEQVEKARALIGKAQP